MELSIGSFCGVEIWGNWTTAVVGEDIDEPVMVSGFLGGNINFDCWKSFGRILSVDLYGVLRENLDLMKGLGNEGVKRS